MNKFKFISLVFIGWFSLTAAMCEGDSSSTHGAGQGSTTYGDINVDDGGTLTIGSLSTPEPVVEEEEGEDLINGCSVESEAEGTCSRE